MTDEALDRLVREMCAPADRVRVESEHALLPPWSASPWVGRYAPRGVMAVYRGQENTGQPHALAAESLNVVSASDGAVLLRGIDYEVDDAYGSICSKTSQPPREVVLSYEYSLLRLDSIFHVDGQLQYRRGVPHLSTPHPPRGSGRRIANVLVPHFGDASNASVWPVLEEEKSAQGGEFFALSGAPLSRSRTARLVFLGDSVTGGAEASHDLLSFPAVAARHVERALPDVSFEWERVSSGGSCLSEWLGPDDALNWGTIVDAAPDVLVLEFVNDAHQAPDAWKPNYDEVRRRLTAIGSKLLLTTPPFTNPQLMGDPDERGFDARPYVRFLRAYAREHNLALADVSRGWEQLRCRGIPYRTLLANGINHPDDRGHEIAGLIIAKTIVGLLS